MSCHLGSRKSGLSHRKWILFSLVHRLYFFRLFIVKEDVTLQRFLATASICGFVPRIFLEAAVSPGALEQAKSDILGAIKSCKDIEDAIDAVVGDLVVPHRAFVIYPGDQDRLLLGCLVKPTSEYAIDTIMMILDLRGADAALDLYKSVQSSPRAAAFRGHIWERKVHNYFRHSAPSFVIRSLDTLNNSTTPNERTIPDERKTRSLDLSKGMKYFAFGPPQMLAGKIAECVAEKEAVYLQLSQNFASLDSIIYQPNDPLVGIQITISDAHPIKVTDLSALQKLLKSKDPLLASLRPTVREPWILLFVVPTPMENSFSKQVFTGVPANWSKKTMQYVLGLDLHQVFRA